MWKFYLWKVLIHHWLMVMVSEWLLMEAAIVRYFQINKYFYVKVLSVKSINSSSVDGQGQWLTTDWGCDCPILLDQQVFLFESFICEKY